MKTFRFSLALLLLPAISFAWNGVGHSTGGAIAFYYLKQHNAAVITKVADALKSHPWYNDQAHWGAKLKGLTGDEKLVTLFMLASTFPDDARSDRKLGGGEKTKWHYVDYPFVPEGNVVTGNPPETPNALEKINELLLSLKTENDPTQKALDICWVFHMIEDIHQPLHTACLFTDEQRDGDRGGNSTYFIRANSETGVKLHSYWDGLIKVPKNTTIFTNAKNMLNKPIYKEAKLTELTTHPNVEDWIIKESFPLAKQVTYDNGNLVGTQDNPTEIEASYETNALKTGERRIVLAGIRVAKELIEIFD